MLRWAGTHERDFFQTVREARGNLGHYESLKHELVE